MQNFWLRTSSPSTRRPGAGGFFDSEILEQRPGFVSALFKGAGAKALFKNEAGGHRWQRIPPTERRGRVQTSTVTVAVLDPEPQQAHRLNMVHVEIVASRGSGPGGQHRNKTESCITATHRPTGISVRIDMRSQHESRRIALGVLGAKLAELASGSVQVERDATRRGQIGAGMRGDKVRTYRTQDDRVTDHRTGCTWSLTKWSRGDWD
jgi:peptide chain release factor 1